MSSGQGPRAPVLHLVPRMLTCPTCHLLSSKPFLFYLHHLVFWNLVQWPCLAAARPNAIWLVIVTVVVESAHTCREWGSTHCSSPSTASTSGLYGKTMSCLADSQCLFFLRDCFIIVYVYNLYIICFYLFETDTSSAVGLELPTLLPLSPKCWEHHNVHHTWAVHLFEVNSLV